MKQINEIAWLGGLLEAEGWFGLDGGKYPIISLKMTDEDIVVKVANIWKSTVTHHKNYWMTRIYAGRAVGWMMTVYPFLGRCRKDKVARIIGFWKNYPSLLRLVESS